MVKEFLRSAHPWADQIHQYDQVESTNTLAKEMAKNGAPHGTVLIADSQTAGRGRLGRSFLSPGGMGVYMSVILRYHCKPEQLMHLTCACGVALCDAVEEAFRIRPGIKWINDLVYDRKKLAGILTELVLTDSQVCAIVGIGINCCQCQEDFEPTIRDMATSIAMITEQTPNREQLAAKIIEQLSVMDTQLLTHRESLMDRYRADCVTLGQSVCVVQGDSVEKGEALDILPDGALRVRLEDGTQKVVNAGEVSIRGMYGYT